jgi:hypothetical protein
MQTPHCPQKDAPARRETPWRNSQKTSASQRLWARPCLRQPRCPSCGSERRFASRRRGAVDLLLALSGWETARCASCFARYYFLTPPLKGARRSALN